jgi:hypothetical protein
MDFWRRIWRSQALRTNDTLIELNITDSCSTDFGSDRMRNLRHLEMMIYECLLTNWSLQEIKLPRYYNTDRAVSEYWRDNIEPLLELNRNLEPGEQRLSVLHYALIRVRMHTEKAFSLLLAYPQALSRVTPSESLSDLVSLGDPHNQAVLLLSETAALPNEGKRDHARDSQGESGRKRARDGDSSD